MASFTILYNNCVANMTVISAHILRKALQNGTLYDFVIRLFLSTNSREITRQTTIIMNILNTFTTLFIFA